MATEVARASLMLAKATAFCLYTVVLAFVTAIRPLRRRPSLSLQRPLRVLVTGTFHNPGWLRAHASPIAAAARVESLVVVTDAPLDPLEKTTYACPPAWLARLLTRAPARLLHVGLSAWRDGSDVLVGYHIMPNALICLLVAALLGRRVVYQMTGGPIQLAGGGGASENALQSRIRGESPLLEKLLLRLVARFDAIVVRGGTAAAFLAERGIAGNVSIIPGGIDLTAFQPAQGLRSYDVIFAGRLVQSKGCELLQETLIRLARRRPELRAAVLGEGPMREAMAAAFSAAGVSQNVEMPGRRNDVHAWMAQSRVFLLTSPSEGLSIALLEAMCAGAVPVVSDVGELGDVVRNGETGFLVSSRTPDEYEARVLEVLNDDGRRETLSRRACEVAREHAGMAAVSQRWDVLLDRLSASRSPLHGRRSHQHTAVTTFRKLDLGGRFEEKSAIEILMTSSTSTTSAGLSRPEVVYILSPSFSGSTLLTFLLAAHPGIATVGELKASAIGDIATYHCSCGSLLTQCNFWLQVQKRMRDLGGELSFEDFGTHYRSGPTAFRKLISLAVWPSSVSWMSRFGMAITPGFRARLDRLSDQNCKLMTAVTEIQQGRVFLDGSKDPERLSQFLDCLGDKVKVIHLIRDGRGVANSYMKHYDVGMPTAAHELVRTTRACERVMRRVPSGNGLMLKYEDVCRAPQEILARIFSLCGLEPHPQVRRTEPLDFHIMGNAMRLEFGKPIKVDEKWRATLEEQHLQEFEQVAGALNRQYGYA